MSWALTVILFGCHTFFFFFLPSVKSKTCFHWSILIFEKNEENSLKGSRFGTNDVQVNNFPASETKITTLILFNEYGSFLEGV